MLSLRLARLAVAPALFASALLLAACPKQVEQAAPSDASAQSGSASAPAEQPPAGAADEAKPADNPVEQQQQADAAPDKVAQPGPDSTETEIKQQQPTMTAEEIFKSANCAMCHGQDLNGTPLGPTLKKLSENWTADQLVIYFQDPATYAANDPRLSMNKGKYSVPMPPTRLPQADLRVLAEWLLEQ